MRENRALVVFLLRALEEADRSERLLPGHARTAATRRAMMVTGLLDSAGKLSESGLFRSGETIFRRARLLFDGLSRKAPELFRILRMSRQGTLFQAAIVIAALPLGFAMGSWLPTTDRAWPHLGLGLIAGWSLFSYIRWAIYGRRRDPLLRRAMAVIVRMTLWRALRIWRSAKVQAEQKKIVHEALVRFGATWKRFARELIRTRVQAVLHGAAMAAAAGASIGVAVDAQQRFNLFDVAMLGLVVAPRLMLMGQEWVHAGRLSSAMPVNFKEPYFRQVFSEWRGSTKKVEVITLGYRPRPATIAGLRTVLNDFFGARAGIRLRDPIHGDAESARLLRDLEEVAANHPEDEHCYVVLLDAEGRQDSSLIPLLEELKSDLIPGKDRLLVLLDATCHGGSSAQRCADARDRWERQLVTLDLKPVLFNVDKPTEDIGVTAEMIAELRGGLWPRPSSGRSDAESS